MSQENVEIVRRGYEALNRGGIDGAVGLLAPGCVGTLFKNRADSSLSTT
jgi:ketosteroid isomerase-like protein